MTVSYMDDAASAMGALAIVKNDMSDGTVWLGAYTVTGDGMVTITDAETKQNINFTIVDVSPRTSMTLDIENYGEVQLKSVTESEFKAYVEEYAKSPEGQRLMKDLKKAKKRINKRIKKLITEFQNLDDSTTLYWEGTLADGTYVSYADDEAKSRAVFSAVKADYSDGEAWYGKYTVDQNGKKTLTDSESGETITYTVTETTPGSAITITVDGYGDIALNAVTKSDVVAYAEQVEKAINQAKAQAK